eukprot:gnl/Hemi2/16138_TR5359_c0_g1_i2.p1 gnl/Hemi2/16138_TR5359_c0_g1~~gnl/Hemi2/16138_TR5359_c0_g1_i2.p1  ORF type:complete len:123 (+),score=44.72 gnl/Hemi2/16138_TR5359_c0_g1_i2:358-726(+)
MLTIIRCFDFNPSETELAEWVKAVEEDDGMVHFERAEKLLFTLLRGRGDKSSRDSEERLKKAFQALVPEGQTYIDPEEFRTLITTRGERFSHTEIEEMLEAAIDSETGVIQFEDIARLLATT